MTRILHLSDLHFGTARQDLVDALAREALRLRPDLVVVSGDLTQRARRWQFRHAMRFLAALEAPVLAVPGNHDVPLFNLPERLFCPWRRWRETMGPELVPVSSGPGYCVVGVNSVNPLSHQRGRLWRSGLARVEAAFRNTLPHDIRIVAVHHPLEQTADADKALADGAAAAIDRLARAGTDVILCGHLHNWRVAPYAMVKGRRAMVQVQAGTALSDRLRSEPNDFNLLEFGDGRLLLRRHVAKGGIGFVPASQACFERGRGGWSTCEPAPPTRAPLQTSALNM